MTDVPLQVTGILAGAAGALGLAATTLTMAKPEELERYRPVCHLNAAWMPALGVLALRTGLGAAG